MAHFLLWKPCVKCPEVREATANTDHVLDQKKHSLLLADAAFRTEYFGDRLDAIQMPVNWLSFESTRQKAHLLDYPYMFHPSSLVSYFRGINFSRMSRGVQLSSESRQRHSCA